jgi:hypothetical protein
MLVFDGLVRDGLHGNLVQVIPTEEIGTL